MEVSLFITCLADLFVPQVGMAVVEVLEHFGCRVDFPREQTCCGQPQFNNGYHAEARKLARGMIEVFERSRVVVTPSASCCAMVREHFPVLFQDDPVWGPRAAALAGKTYEFVEFLTKVLRVDLKGLALPEPVTGTYHYTCHMRGLGLAAGPGVELFGQMGNTKFVPLEKSEQCCGFGGMFATNYPDISGGIVRDKVACAARSGAGVVIVNDAGCAMNIAGAAHRAGETFQVKHIAELIAEAIRHSSRRA